MNSTIKSIGIIVVASGLSACAGMSNTEKGTLIGAGTGAVAGSVISGGNPVGTAAGAIAGGVIGHELGEDKDRREGRR
jgi:osmotically inducible lipoprotein OsmB